MQLAVRLARATARGGVVVGARRLAEPGGVAKTRGPRGLRAARFAFGERAGELPFVAVVGGGREVAFDALLAIGIERAAGGRIEQIQLDFADFGLRVRVADGLLADVGSLLLGQGAEQVGFETGTAVSRLQGRSYFLVSGGREESRRLKHSVIQPSSFSRSRSARLRRAPTGMPYSRARASRCSMRARPSDE